ncbi:MAG: insulinase family protein [Candidatus Aminicenantes bacterium]|nr:insulinase family protein [Candidatus Aminicenantes bacterium]MDH5705386.1 insulinase family protein [Candidatus Aminicenantes bacterium]
MNLRLIKTLFILWAFVFLFVGASGIQPQETKKFPFSATLYKLKNGLHVILSEDHSLPIVSVVMAYSVGSMNEQPGKTGLAYLMENLMFQGSENIGRMQHVSIINRVGGELNATTTVDRTVFLERVPSNQLTQVLWLESDRMKSLQINAAKVEKAKQEIIADIRSRKASNPYLESYWRFDQLLYPSFAYSHPVIGDEADLQDLTVQDVKDFYNTYYVPNNAVLSIAGKIDRERALMDIRKYFETIPEGKEIPHVPLSKSPEKMQIHESMESDQVPSPGFHLGYRLAHPSSDDFYVLSLIEYILLRGNTSRLHKRLIKRERLALHMNGSIEKRYPAARFKLFILNNNQFMVQRTQRAIFSELHRLKTSFIPSEELQKSKNMFKMDYVDQYTDSLSRALFLAEEFLFKRILINPSEELLKYLAVTPTDIVGVSNRYFGEDSVILDIEAK